MAAERSEEAKKGLINETYASHLQHTPQHYNIRERVYIHCEMIHSVLLAEFLRIHFGKAQVPG